MPRGSISRYFAAEFVDCKKREPRRALPRSQASRVSETLSISQIITIENNFVNCFNIVSLTNIYYMHYMNTIFITYLILEQTFEYLHISVFVKMTKKQQKSDKNTRQLIRKDK